MNRLLDAVLPLLGKTVSEIKTKHQGALTSKASGHVLALPPIGRRPRKTFVTIDVTGGRVSELAVLFDMANDGDKIRAALVKRFGPAKTSKQHKCRMRGCVYGTKPAVVAKEIETRGTWLLRVQP